MPETPPSDGTEVEPEERPASDSVEFVETYETDDGIVFYDVDNPLAWLESDRIVPLDETV